MDKHVKLKSFTRDEVHEFKTKEWVYEVKHNNGKTTLRQDLNVKAYRDGTYSVEVCFDGFPKLSDKKEAIAKLGDWLSRLGESIQKGVELDIDEM